MNNGKSRHTSNGRPAHVIDADGHVRETDEEIIEYMSPGYRSRRDAMLYFPLVPDRREWAQKLDEGKIERTILYPTRFMHIGQIGNPKYAAELCRAYNDFL